MLGELFAALTHPATQMAHLRRFGHILALCILCLAIPSVRAQLGPAPGVYQRGYYRSPVGREIKASGTFGELRRDHFHMGLDIKSVNRSVGDPVYAVADGYVSRLKISSAGYGNAIYVDHPNGTRSLYAHLDDFVPEVQAFLDSVHYAREEFEVEVQLSPKRLPVRAGQRLGSMGNTGSSQGPHLHFELRLSATDEAFNPLLYDFPIRDGLAPSLRGLTVYSLDRDGKPARVAKQSLARKGDDYTSNEVVVPPGKVAFGLKAYDVAEGTSNLNGVFGISCRVDGRLVWRSFYDTIAFEQTRFIQAHYDYAAQSGGEGYYYRLHKLPGDRLRIYETVVDHGAVPVGFGESRQVEIQAGDAFGNTSTLRFTVRGDTTYRPAPGLPPFNFVLVPERASDFSLGDAGFRVEAGSVYTKTFLRGAIRTAATPGAYSSCYDIGQDEEPLQRPVRASVPLDNVPAELRAKAYFGSCGAAPRKTMGGRLSADGRTLEGEMGYWRSFAVFVDTVPPTIKALSRGVYRISDEVSSARDLTYRVTQNGQWVLAALDAKSDRLAVRTDKLRPGPIRVTVSDEAGNVTAIEQ